VAERARNCAPHERSGSATLALKVVTPRRLLVDAEVSGVSLPGLDGELASCPGIGRWSRRWGAVS